MGKTQVVQEIAMGISIFSDQMDLLQALVGICMEMSFVKNRMATLQLHQMTDMEIQTSKILMEPHQEVIKIDMAI